MDETSPTLKENPTPISESELNPIAMAETSETPKENPTETPSKETPTDIAEILEKTVIGESSETPDIPTENPPVPIAGPSRQNQESSFSFRLKPVRIMKRAIDALADTEFNPQGSARIDVDDTGFKITVHNPDTHVTGFLLLGSPGLIDFSCAKPVEDKSINLATFSDKLKGVDDEDTLTICLLDGLTELAVKYGRPPFEGFTVKLESTAPQEVVADLTADIDPLFFEITAAAEDLEKSLRRMLNRFQEGLVYLIAEQLALLIKLLVPDADLGFYQNWPLNLPKGWYDSGLMWIVRGRNVISDLLPHRPEAYPHCLIVTLVRLLDEVVRRLLYLRTYAVSEHIIYWQTHESWVDRELDEICNSEFRSFYSVGYIDAKFESLLTEIDDLRIEHNMQFNSK